MNLEKRTEVLERALIIEDKLSQILRALLDIDLPESKTLSHKASSLTFMTKVNLLYDVDKISLDTYRLLQLFGEIRNQFMHNLDAETYIIVIDRIEKKTKILNLVPEHSKYFDNANDKDELEKVYSLAFQKLSIHILENLRIAHEKVIQNKIIKIKNEISKNEKDRLEELLLLFASSIDEFADFMTERTKELTGYKGDFGNIIQYGVNAFFEKKLKELKQTLTAHDSP
jgi:hypothetical protein